VEETKWRGNREKKKMMTAGVAVALPEDDEWA
jgi:hypothetical protein